MSKVRTDEPWWVIAGPIQVHMKHMATIGHISLNMIAICCHELMMDMNGHEIHRQCRYHEGVLVHGTNHYCKTKQKQQSLSCFLSQYNIVH